MNVTKKIVDSIQKCYAVTEFSFDGKKHVACAAEREGACSVYDFDGSRVDTIWKSPGGVMTLLQYPNGNEPIMMATQNFFSPDDSATATIVYYTREGSFWQCHKLCDLPFVHRFGILERDNIKYLVACTIKSASAFEGDWTCPGRVWAARLPEDIRKHNADNPLKLTPVFSGLYQNHGFLLVENDEMTYAMIGTKNGIFNVFPPKRDQDDWQIEPVLETPASDILWQDYDNDGDKELLVLSPFHGDTVSIYKRINGQFVKVWEREKKMPFIHAIWGERFEGKEFAFVGNRNEEREFICIYYDENKGGYCEELIDKGAGPANTRFFIDNNGSPCLIAANRETDEVAFYYLNDLGR